MPLIVTSPDESIATVPSVESPSPQMILAVRPAALVMSNVMTVPVKGTSLIGVTGGKVMFRGSSTPATLTEFQIVFRSWPERLKDTLSEK